LIAVCLLIFMGLSPLSNDCDLSVSLMLCLVHCLPIDEALRCLRSLLRPQYTNQCGEVSSPHVGIDVMIDVGIGEEVPQWLMINH